MADKPWSVAFAGTGDTSEENIKGLLDDWLPQKLEHVTIPSRIGRTHKGLKNVKDWLTDEVGEDSLESVPVAELADVLIEHRNNGTDVYLVYIPDGEWDEESDGAKLVRTAVEHGIPVKDLSEGLDDFVPPEPVESAEGKPGTAAGPEEQPAPRRRGKPRGEAPTAAEEAVADAKEFTRDALSSIGVEAPGASQAPGVQVTLSQATIDALLAAVASLAADVKAAVQADLPGKPGPKTYPFWVDADGNYRPRTGRGRGKLGEEKADLTMAEVEQLGLEFPA